MMKNFPQKQTKEAKALITGIRFFVFLVTFCWIFCVSAASVSAQQVSLNGAVTGTGNGWGKGGKPKPSPTPGPDGESDWNNLGTDWNTAGNWTGVGGGIAPPSSSDVAWFKAAASAQPNLSASTTIVGLYFNGGGTNGYDITSTNTTITLTLTATGTAIGTEISNTTAVAIGAENTSGTNTISAPIILAPASGTTSTIYQASGGTLVINGAISGSGITLDKEGAGTLTLAGANTYSGGTTVGSGSILQLGTSAYVIAANAISSGPLGKALLTLSDGATLRSNGSTGQLVLNNVSASGSITLGASATQTGSLTFSSTNGVGTIVPAPVFTLTADTTLNTLVAVTINDKITGAFNLTKAGTGTLTLGGAATNTVANNYSGTTTINAGELDLSKAAGTTAIAGNITIGDGSLTDTLKLINSDQIADTSDVTLNAAGLPVFNLNGKNETIDALNSTNTSAAVTLGAGTLTVGANNETAANFAGVISGTGSLIKTGTGTQILSGTDSFNGNLDILNGDLRFDSGGTANSAIIRLGDTSGSNVAVLSLGVGSGNNVGSVLTVRSGSSGTKLLRSLATSGTNTYSGVITMNDNLTLESSTGGTLLFQGGSIDVTNKTLTVDTQIYNSPSLNGSNGVNGQGAVTINEVLGSSLASGGALVKDGSNTLILQSTSNTYTGTNAATLNANGTTIKDGILGIYGDGSLGLAPSSATNNIFFASSSLTSATNTPTLQDTSGNITLAATRNINVASGVTGTFDSNGNTFTVNGVINGSGNLAKIGTGTLVLAGTNTYTGTTTVNAGTMLVNGSTSSSSAVTVNSSGTLGGIGTVGGTVDVKSGGTLAPGSSPGILTTGALTLESGSTLSIALNNTTLGSGYSQVVTPSVSLMGSNLTLNIGGTLSVGQQFFIVDNTGIDPVVGVFAQGATVTSGSYTFLIDYVANFDTTSAVGGNDIMLQVTAIPEPSTYFGAALACLTIGYTLRRRFMRRRVAA